LDNDHDRLNVAFGSEAETRDRPSGELSLDAPAALGYPKAMAKEIPSVGDLRRKSEITDAEIEAATAAFLADEGAPPFTFSSGHRIDVGRAIDMHPQAKKLLAGEATAPGLRRTMVKTAVILGFPVAG
jgi:hypothetical protein